MEKGLTPENSTYVRVLEELVDRLARFAAGTEEGKRLLPRLRREVVEAALHEVSSATTAGAWMIALSDHLGRIVKTPTEELSRIEGRYRARNNPGVKRDFIKRRT